MTLKRIFTVFCCVLLALCMTSAAQAKGMTAAVAEGPVVMNGQAIDSTTAQYPLLVYNSITYVPMTYDLCRFMGLTTDWDDSTKTLSIDQSQKRSAYVPDTGSSRRTGSVPVTKVVNPVVVCDVPIDNSVETYPLFLYNGVTYFPLTFDYMTAAFGWTYTWDAANGLDITCLERPARPSEKVDTGDSALDAVLETLNAFYRQGHAYSGTLTDRRDGSVQRFEANTRIVFYFDLKDVQLTADPFVFFENGVYVSAHYYGDAGLTGEPSFSGGWAFSNHTPEGPYINLVPPVPPDDIGDTETEYLAWCFLDCQFSGARAQKIRSSSRETQGELTTWHLNVAFETDGFTEYNASITIDESRDAVTAIEIETVNYVLHMSVKS